MSMGRSLLRLIERLRGSFAWVEANELKRRLDRGEAVTVVDVRGRDEFVGPLGHIANAILIPLGELAGRAGELSRDRPIVAVCRAGSRSAQALSILQQNGFTNVANLTGGMLRWRAEAHPVEGGSS